MVELNLEPTFEQSFSLQAYRRELFQEHIYTKEQLEEMVYGLVQQNMVLRNTVIQLMRG